MEVSVVSRTEANGRRIIESVWFDKGEAESERYDILKRYNGRPDLCADTETDSFTTCVYVALVVTKYDDPTKAVGVDVLEVGFEGNCLKKAAEEIVHLRKTCGLDKEEGDARKGWVGHSPSEAATYTVQVHEKE